MNEHPNTESNSTRLRIWQQNLNASLTAQASLLNNHDIANWDLIAIQEPHINFLRNTSANHHWHVLYLTLHYTQPQHKTQAVTLVSASLDTNSWKQISFPSADVVIIQLSGPYGICTIFNIYNDCNSPSTLTALSTFLDSNMLIIKPVDSDHMMWLSDFNQHHPLWEDICNCHLFNYTAARPLIDLIADQSMLQLLPCDIPTLQSTSTGNWTRPDNVFGTEYLRDAIISCNTDPVSHGPRTDHVPILTILDLETPRADLTPRRNWRAVNWEEFNTRLDALISTHPPQPLASDEEFQQAARHLTQSIMETMDECVPFLKPCPHSKHWWNQRLTDLRNKVTELSWLSYLMRGLPLHTCHVELKATKNLYANKIKATKKQHWLDWLEDIEGNDLWTANLYVTSDPSDGGKARVPTLIVPSPDGTIIEATTNANKSLVIAKSFFPPPPCC